MENNDKTEKTENDEAKKPENFWQKFKKKISKNKDYISIDDAAYYEKFGIIVKDSKYAVDESVSENLKVSKVEEAYRKACQNRDFEIDKFWSRATYFWGFIVLIFTAYFTILTSEHAKENLGELYRFIVVVLNCSGLLFTIAWLYVIIGSKHWQENWEAHIDYLEDFITGPLFKTIHFKRRFYSVTGVNQTLAYIVIGVWLSLLIAFLGVNHRLPWDAETTMKKDWLVLFPIIATFMGFFLMWLFNKKSFKVTEKGFIRRDSPTPTTTKKKIEKG